MDVTESDVGAVPGIKQRPVLTRPGLCEKDAQATLWSRLFSDVSAGSRQGTTDVVSSTLLVSSPANSSNSAATSLQVLGTGSSSNSSVLTYASGLRRPQILTTCPTRRFAACC